MSSIFWWTFLLVRFILKVISYLTLCKIELSPKGDRKKIKTISYVKLKMSSMSKFRIFMVDGGWCPTFWFFKSLDNIMVYVKEIRVFWGRSPEVRGDLRPPRAWWSARVEPRQENQNWFDIYLRYIVIFCSTSRYLNGKEKPKKTKEKQIAKKKRRKDKRIRKTK